ncbi:MAG: Aminodeoxyfutalosine deaminase [Candidatus Scalindua arabica]|uniref:Aminodeoxyfutalosine deaminase n=1 Tax=Candidatus Scalindua arabica TaxID=1127984 RepID=A0A941W1C5_9BACT|nr:Aminodeoxyfutalosine deaminase [Candidatus Scalindua arabica]
MLLLKSRYLLKDASTVIDNGAVLIDNGKVKFAGSANDISNRESCQIIDLGNSAIVPGFVNTHTHLDLTHLHNIIKYNGDFTDWIRQLVDAKKEWTESEYLSSIRSGIKSSLESGTTTVVDITRNGLALEELQKSKIRKSLFYELIDFNPDSTESTIDNFKNMIRKVKRDDLLSIGIFPHAPYTVSEELYRRSKAVAEESGFSIATHISETIDEAHFLTRGTGKFISLLRDFDMLKEWKPPGLKPVNYLKNIGFLENGCILVHCNYLKGEEVDHIEESNSTIVFCPRSHKYFRHKDHPSYKLGNRDINVALGTDSLASNDSLSILDEMKYIYTQHKTSKPQDILCMGTIAGATALRLNDKIGKLEEGYDADIAVVDIKKETVTNIYDGIFSHDSECVLTVVSGTICYDKHGVTREASVN